MRDKGISEDGIQGTFAACHSESRTLLVYVMCGHFGLCRG